MRGREWSVGAPLAALGVGALAAARIEDPVPAARMATVRTDDPDLAVAPGGKICYSGIAKRSRSSAG